MLQGAEVVLRREGREEGGGAIRRAIGRRQRVADECRQGEFTGRPVNSRQGQRLTDLDD